MKFRVIQSNNRGLITKVGDKTFYSRKPKKEEEFLAFPTLFIWVRKNKRLVARAWTKWTGECINDDFIYVVTRFRDLIDITGQNHFHQWSTQFLRIQLWEMKAPKVDIKQLTCPPPEEVWEGGRNKNSIYLNLRKERMKKQTPKLSSSELCEIKKIYKKRNDLNLEAGFIKFHVDHIVPLSKGGKHQLKNLRIISAKDNLRKSSNI